MIKFSISYKIIILIIAPYIKQCTTDPSYQCKIIIILTENVVYSGKQQNRESKSSRLSDKMMKYHKYDNFLFIDL